MRNWVAWVGMKYGTLTIEKFLGKVAAEFGVEYAL